jgi:hypothetical protein
MELFKFCIEKWVRTIKPFTNVNNPSQACALNAIRRLTLWPMTHSIMTFRIMTLNITVSAYL